MNMATKQKKTSSPTLDERAIAAGNRKGQKAIVSRSYRKRDGAIKAECVIIGHKTTYGKVSYLVEMAGGDKAWVTEDSLTFTGEDNNSNNAA